MLITNTDTPVFTQSLTPMHIATAVSLQASESVRGSERLRAVDCLDRQWCLPACNPSATQGLEGLEDFNKPKCFCNHGLIKVPFCDNLTVFTGCYLTSVTGKAC